MRRHISGREATNMAIESDKRGPGKMEPMPADGAGSAPTTTAGSAALATVGGDSPISLPSEPVNRTSRPRSPSPAERMRLHRKRRRSGMRHVRILLDATEINTIIHKGYLDQKSRDDRLALEFAIDAIIWDALNDEE